MKTKIILVLIICAIATISFSFTSSNNAENVLAEQPTSVAESTEPLGGFVSEDKF